MAYRDPYLRSSLLPGSLPGIDLVYYGNQRHLEYDLIVTPGADPTHITLGFEGAETVAIDAQGDLVLHAPGGEVRLHQPRVYQETEGTRHVVPARYVLLPRPPGAGSGEQAHEVGFVVAAYDTSQPLIIDPVLSYATYLGGSGRDVGQGIAVDSAGNAYVTGRTNSINKSGHIPFPTTPGAVQPTGSRTVPEAPWMAFVTKLNPAGTAFVYSTYLGGSVEEQGLGIAVDSTGNAYVTGYTASTDFPTTPGAVQLTLGGYFDVFVTKLNPTGSALLYSTYLGGAGEDVGRGIVVDSAGNAYVTGWTWAPNFPTTPGAIQPTLSGVQDAFVTKLNPAGSALVYSTYLGGSGQDGGSGLAVDSTGNAYVAGFTASPNFPATPGAVQPTFGGGPFDAFVTKLNPAGSALVYSTYLGGSREDQGFGLAVDSTGNAYVAGFTASPNFPATLGAVQPPCRRLRPPPAPG